jgi:hypothetical protein
MGTMLKYRDLYCGLVPQFAAEDVFSATCTENAYASHTSPSGLIPAFAAGDMFSATFTGDTH